MTDEDKKAFLAFFQVHDDNSVVGCWSVCAQEVWEAAAEHYMRKERERCAEIVFAEIAHFKSSGETAIEIPYLEVMLGEIEEPKE